MGKMDKIRKTRDFCKIDIFNWKTTVGKGGKTSIPNNGQGFTKNIKIGPWANNLKTGGRRPTNLIKSREKVEK